MTFINAVLSVQLFRTNTGNWNWMVTDLSGGWRPSQDGGGCGTPEQALKEALWRIGYASCDQEPKGRA